MPRRDPKVFHTGQAGEFLVGFTSSFRMGQILRWSFEPPPIDEDLDRYMGTAFIDAVRSALAAGGYAIKKDERESGGTFLVGVRGRIFQIQDDYQVGELGVSYDSVGIGNEVALGVLYALDEHGPVPAERRVVIAIDAAARFCSGVRTPISVWRSGTPLPVVDGWE